MRLRITALIMLFFYCVLSGQNTFCAQLDGNVFTVEGSVDSVNTLVLDYNWTGASVASWSCNLPDNEPAELFVNISNNSIFLFWVNNDEPLSFDGTILTIFFNQDPVFLYTNNYPAILDQNLEQMVWTTTCPLIFGCRPQPFGVVGNNPPIMHDLMGRQVRDNANFYIRNGKMVIPNRMSSN